MLNLFYQEPEPDRWIRFDRYPRKMIRGLLRGPRRPGGQMMVFINLCKGLDRLGVPYRVNDFRHAVRHEDELVCIVGKPFVLDKLDWKNPILYGASICSHPLDDPNLLSRLPVKKILVPGPWMEAMCQPIWGDAVHSWAVGIDTEMWRPSPSIEKSVDVLLYDKVLWDRERCQGSLTSPIRSALTKRGLSFEEVRYGAYREADYRAALDRCRSMIFLCEHETQGIAYQQALACNVPILAWDQGGPWRDPDYYPERVVFAPVSSVPYWDFRCGEKFACAADFEDALSVFLRSLKSAAYSPRDFILENLTLEKCARQYIGFVDSVRKHEGRPHAAGGQGAE